MKFNCEIDNIKTLKKGMKITLAIDDKQTLEVMKNIYNFMDKPVKVELVVDDKKQLERLNQITGEQRDKIFAIVKDIAEHTGEDREYTRKQTRESFMRATGHEEFSLSNCNKELAGEYIEYLIRLALELGVAFKVDPREGLEDTEGYLRMCIENNQCCICGEKGEVGYAQGGKIALCNLHRQEYQIIGPEEFEKKYHVFSA